MIPNPLLAHGLYGASLSLLTDLYQLTMAYAYWKSGREGDEAIFHLYFRKSPFGGGFTVACGLGPVIETVQRMHFRSDDLAYLATLTGNDGAPLFETAFLDHLAALRFDVDLDAVPEGTVVFPNEPLVRVKGPLIAAQILETALLNLANFETLIATKAARMCLAAKGQPVIEFGLRRAHGIDGALAASRAAYVGGCEATSNVLAGRLYGIPVKGTHAHSWVMSFPTEEESFRAYAKAMPNNAVFLVDTYDTLRGVAHAVEAGAALRRDGHEMVGVRLDSGDLAYLSVEARKLLDAGGFPKATIVASNDLDEQIITSLKDQGAAIDVWGVGTRLVTAYDQPALGGVYKLSAIRRDGGAWEYKVKLSEQTAKVSTPGILGVRRFVGETECLGDMIYNEAEPPHGAALMIDPVDPTRRKAFAADLASEELLVPVLRKGELVYQVPSLAASRDRTSRELSRFHAGVKRFVNPHQYPVGLEKGLHDLRTRLILAARGFAE